MPDTAAELSALKQQLEQVREARLSAPAPTTPPPVPVETDAPGVDTIPEALSDWLDENGELDPEIAMEKIQKFGREWLEGFNEDLSDAKPSSILAIFALGVMVGKLS
ncbi:hypothetical protein EY643_11935 [Halioglobus maricola]|uniref:Uncharacterized protein n=1 Tax=Halioglobus maricola TaxID=2601894 RepID=A0A5P9NKC2_9GAMM|nr:hypothetical protein [Halioglobus maricola]QFU76313.1 hypothetical protein EY643_11935 [Halioglobus maricola]